MGYRKHTDSSTLRTNKYWKILGVTLPRWLWLIVVGVILFIIQFGLPDPVEDGINALLRDPNSLPFTGVVPLLKALLIIWKISGIGLFIYGIVDLFLSRSRSHFE